MEALASFDVRATLLSVATVRTAAITAALLCFCAGPLAANATAVSKTVNCAGLQAALNQVQNGDVITLDQLCTKTNSGPANGAFLIPDSNSVSFTLTGKPGSGAGFNGTGVSHSLLSAGFTSSNLITIRITHLTFEHGTAGTSETGSGAPFDGGAIHLSGDYDIALGHDTFSNNGLASSDFLSGGAVALFGGGRSGSISITNSIFVKNAASEFGGAVDIEEANSNNEQIPITLSHDLFSSNSLSHASGSSNLLGGAIAIENSSAGEALVTQTSNRFLDNSITGGGASANGGAEGMYGMDLSSTGDVFIGNSLRAAPSGFDSEGAALSIENNTCNPSTPLTLTHTATNLLVAGNSITAGGAAGSAHGAIYVGCNEGTGGNNLTLSDSTVSGNAGGGGTAGIFGDPTDNLTLNNSILAGNSGGATVTGFGSGGSVTAMYSDLCTHVPFTGSHNICAAPKLVSAPTGNVRETSSSPTIDRGSNALVPHGVTKDVYGAARIQARAKGGTPRVDMGAAEFPTQK